MKKQVVFVEYVPTVPVFKIARTLKLSGIYETVLVCYSDVNNEFYKKAYDKIICLDIKHKINPKNLYRVLRKVLSKKGRKFFRDIRELNPYIFQFTGPDLFTMATMFFTKNRPKIYYAYDIWAFFGKKWSFENIGVKEAFQRRIERICFKKSSGVLHKGLKDELKLLRYKINKPEIAVVPGCLDEWIVPPRKHLNKKQAKEIHLVYAGGPLASWNGRVDFLRVVRIITSQKIHFHTTDSCVIESDNAIYAKEEKDNNYFHFHKRGSINDFQKILALADYGVLLDFFDTSIINPLWPETSMANKIFNYLEAGIPTIINRQSKVMSEVIVNNGAGFSIDFDDLNNLRKIIENQDYNKIQENVRKAQEKLRMGGIIKDIERFYNSVVEMNNKKKK